MLSLAAVAAEVTKEETNLLLEVARVLGDISEKNSPVETSPVEERETNYEGGFDTVLFEEANDLTSKELRVQEVREVVDEEIDDLVDRHANIFRYQVGALYKF